MRNRIIIPGIRPIGRQDRRLKILFYFTIIFLIITYSRVICPYSGNMTPSVLKESSHNVGRFF